MCTRRAAAPDTQEAGWAESRRRPTSASPAGGSSPWGTCVRGMSALLLGTFALLRHRGVKCRGRHHRSPRWRASSSSGRRRAVSTATVASTVSSPITATLMRSSLPRPWRRSPRAGRDLVHASHRPGKVQVILRQTADHDDRRPRSEAELEAERGAEIIPFSAPDLAGAIERLRDSPEEWRHRRAAALAFARRYDWRTFLKPALASVGFVP
jgi:hypothetical protein